MFAPICDVWVVADAEWNRKGSARVGRSPFQAILTDLTLYSETAIAHARSDEDSSTLLMKSKDLHDIM